ncbi:cannabinoid receptor type 1B-like [Paramacrobiotus metropolitanus]|uniref:cannabinoid receptor type 1B-like n=1 Tax=Paramacrobiotus metropolitanus TaxID=2943436 RepID=UPI0024464B35|nr:cannabinoid receptor type 1B-like [Paramacrobiotus metropolitanus]
MMMQSHVLITTNRIWAVSFPLFYQRHHSTKTALLLCVGMWIIFCLFLLPGLLVDATIRNTADNVNCLMTTEGHPLQEKWSMAIEFLLYILPVFIILFAYPVICWKRHQRHKARMVIRPRLNTGEGAVVPSLAKASRRDSSDGISTADNSPQQRTSTSKSFTVLTLLTVAVVICWTPLVSFFTISLFAKRYIAELYEVGQILWALEPALDPVLFSIALKDLRVEIRNLFHA